MQRGELSPGTVTAYRKALARFSNLTRVKTVGQLQALDAAELQEAIQESFDRWSKASVKVALLVAAKVWRQAYREKLVSTFPFHGIERVRIGDNVPEGRVLLPGARERILERLAQEGRWLELAAFSLMSLHGLRSHEALSLRWRDIVDTPEGKVIVFIGKGGKEARMRLKPEVVDALFVKLGGGQPMPPDARVLSKGERPISYSKLYRMVVETTGRIAGRAVSPHALRATYISSTIGTRGLEEARRLARHALVTVTTRYSRWATLSES